MKVGDFVKKYVGHARYSNDRRMLDMYADVEMLAYAVSGASDDGNTYLRCYGYGFERCYISVIVFRTTRMMVGFLNGQRVSLPIALSMLSMELKKDTTHIDQIQNQVVMEEL